MKRRKRRLGRKVPRCQSVHQWGEEDLSALLFNPVYGYGRWLEPAEVVVAQVLARNVELAEKQRTEGRILTLDELDAEFTTLMDGLVAEELCQRMEDLPPIVPKETWLRAQQETIRRLAEGEAL